ncbi:MAG: hypothetical protein HY063_14340 [Bacteroidetes bacterium]|nr:hypothetical protein [Bacteroidota bacterium]
MKRIVFFFICSFALSAFAQKNKPLARQLDSIFNDDQKYREIAMRFDNDSIGRIIRKQDSVNLVKVKVILDKYGWLGADEVGANGNTALFLVIQHADLKTQEKYLPVMKEAVKNKKARASSLALLIDRVEMRNNRPQIYGSQVQGNSFYTILDEKNVNKRRAEVGLEPLEDYAKHFGIEYKLPEK